MAQVLVIEAQGREIKRVALRGLRQSGPIPFADWVTHLQQEAVAEQRRQRAARGSGTGKRAAAGWLATLVWITDIVTLDYQHRDHTV
jgi:hypothetical protein